MLSQRKGNPSSNPDNPTVLRMTPVCKSTIISESGVDGLAGVFMGTNFTYYDSTPIYPYQPAQMISARIMSRLEIGRPSLGFRLGVLGLGLMV